uniref:P-type domain-containing protein n=1 Tax=Myripristis murdjan TaxID=586833 RepID=A0A667ZXX8_9TELE
ILLYTFGHFPCSPWTIPLKVTDDDTTEVHPTCDIIPLGQRVDCFPDGAASKQKCEQRGCCPLDERNAPWCFFSKQHGYTVESVEQPSPTVMNTRLKRMSSPSLFGADIEKLSFHAEMQSQNRLRFKITDAHKQRFEVPHEHVSSINNIQASTPISNILEITHKPFGLIVCRKENNKVLFDTSVVFADQYLQLSTMLEQVVQEFLNLIGRPVIPPYWSLGFQLSRWDYGSLDGVKKTVDRNRAVGLPYDIQYTDIDYMEDKKDFTYDKIKFRDLPQFADYMHEKGQKYILILDPAIATSTRVGNASYDSYERGTEKNAWVTESDGKTPLLGEVWPGETVFPDYTSPNCIDWWVDEYDRFYKEIKHDALWIDMNEDPQQGSKTSAGSEGDPTMSSSSASSVSPDANVSMQAQLHRLPPASKEPIGSNHIILYMSI